MGILCIETSGEHGSAAVCNNEGEVLSQLVISRSGQHAALLTTAIEDAMQRADLTFKDIAAVAVSHGPGSYTGLRIGLSVAKGICYARRIPLIAIPTLTIIADTARMAYPEAQTLIPMIDARRMEVYAAVFNKNLEVLEPAHAKILDKDSFGQYINTPNAVCVCGTGSEKCQNLIGKPNTVFAEYILPVAADMATMAAKMFREATFADTAYCEPFYLKEYQAVISKNKVLNR